MIGNASTGADHLITSALAFGRHDFPESVEIGAYIESCQARPANQRGMGLDDATGAQKAT